MSQLKELKWIDGYAPQYWEGKANILVRYWVYLYRGLDFINQARYLVIGILGLYAVLKLTNPMWLLAMFSVSVPTLVLVGRWQLYKVSSTQEYITTILGTVTGYGTYNLALKNVELQEALVEQQKEVINLLAKLNEQSHYPNKTS